MCQLKYQFQCGINRLLNGWFKALSCRTSLMLCKSTLAVKFLMAHFPFKFTGLVTNGFQGNKVMFFRCWCQSISESNSKTSAVLNWSKNASRQYVRIIEPNNTFNFKRYEATNFPESKASSVNFCLAFVIWYGIQIESVRGSKSASLPLPVSEESLLYDRLCVWYNVFHASLVCNLSAENPFVLCGFVVPQA